jgi:hypothetical protein
MEIAYPPGRVRPAPVNRTRWVLADRATALSQASAHKTGRDHRRQSRKTRSGQAIEAS